MVKCLKCGASNPNNIPFHRKCNKSLQEKIDYFCDKCNAKLSKGDKRCGKCGSVLKWGDVDFVDNTDENPDELEQALNSGAVVIYENNKYVTVRYPKEFDWLIFIILLILGLIPGLFYLLYWMGKSSPEETFKKIKR